MALFLPIMVSLVVAFVLFFPPFHLFDSFVESWAVATKRSESSSAIPEEKPSLGVRIREDSDDAHVKVEKVFFGSPAEKTGILIGDEILTIDGRTVSKNGDVIDIVGSHRVNDTVAVRILRNGLEQTLEVKLYSFNPPPLADQADTRTAGAIFQSGLAMTGRNDYNSALKEFDLVIELRPGKDASDYFWRGTCYRHLRQYESAIKDFNTALSMEPTASNYIGRGVAYAEAGKNEDALADFDSALKLDPNDSWINTYKGIVYLDSDRPEEALKQFNEAISKAPNVSKQYIWRAKYYMNKGEYDSALRDLDDAVRYDTTRLRKGEPYFFRAQVYEKLGRSSDAESDKAMAKSLGVPARFD